MNVLWSLPRAAPVLLRHLTAYAELAARDLGRAQREATAQLVASMLVISSLFFVALMVCLAVVAATWDTTHRLQAIAAMGGGFALLALGAVAYRSRVVRDRSPLLSAVRREWQTDRVILDRILTSVDD
jgi:uncharacterized membrane protein YqjE